MGERRALPSDERQQWELSEVAFRVELLELDRHLVPAPIHEEQLFEAKRRALIAAIFPDEHCTIPSTPPPKDRGLSACTIEGRMQSLEALRRLVVRWPEHPPHFDHFTLTMPSERARLLAFERDVAFFYVQNFYQMSGRAAVVPRILPE